MKKTMSLAKRLVRAVFIMILPAILLLSGSVMAQNASRESSGTSGEDPLVVFMNKYPEAPVVRKFKSNPENPAAVIALKEAAMVENPAAFPGVTEDEIAVIKLKQSREKVNPYGPDGLREKAPAQTPEQGKNDAPPSLMAAPAK